MKQGPLRKFSYCWMHTKSGAKGCYRDIKAGDRWEFLEILGQWNRESALFLGGAFVYWEAD